MIIFMSAVSQRFEIIEGVFSASYRLSDFRCARFNPSTVGAMIEIVDARSAIRI